MKKYGIFVFYCILLLSLLCSCSSKPNADMLMREATVNANAMKSCDADYTTELVFDAGGTPGRFYTKTENTYFATPFALKSVQSTALSGKEESQTTYTMEEGKGSWFYSNMNGNWQKTAVESMDSVPTEQIDILRLLKKVKSYKLLRGETLDNTAVYKFEMKFESEVLRSPVENIIIASGIGKGSRTIAGTLLESAPSVYGYCYITQDSGRIQRVELDASDVLNQIFNNIEGGDVKISVSKYTVCGNVRNIDSAAAIKLPEDAVRAETVQAAG